MKQAYFLIVLLSVSGALSAMEQELKGTKEKETEEKELKRTLYDGVKRIGAIAFSRQAQKEAEKDIEKTGKQEEAVELKEKTGFVQIGQQTFARPGHEKEVTEVIAKFKEFKAGTAPLEEKRIMAPATLLAKVGLKSEEWNFTMLESQLNKMNIAQFNALVNIVSKDSLPSQRLLHEIIKHQSTINTVQKEENRQIIDLVRWWKIVALGTGAGLSLLLSLQALYVALNG